MIFVLTWLTKPWRSGVRLPRFFFIGLALLPVGFVVMLLSFQRDSINGTLLGTLLFNTGSLIVGMSLVVWIVRGVRRDRARANMAGGLPPPPQPTPPPA